MYSQNNEEQFIAEFFKDRDRGKLLDIGAYDGINLSNTRRLMELGWHGVFVEPAPHNLSQLMLNCAAFLDRSVFVAAAIAGESGLRHLWVDNYLDRKWCTTINQELKDSGAVMVPSDCRLLVPAITLDQMAHLGPFDFISCDAEWEDMGILKTAPDRLLKPCQLLCIETRNAVERVEMKAYLTERGFNVDMETPENLLASHL